MVVLLWRRRRRVRCVCRVCVCVCVFLISCNVLPTALPSSRGRGSHTGFVWCVNISLTLSLFISQLDVCSFPKGIEKSAIVQCNMKTDFYVFPHTKNSSTFHICNQSFNRPQKHQTVKLCSEKRLSVHDQICSNNVFCAIKTRCCTLKLFIYVYF